MIFFCVSRGFREKEGAFCNLRDSKMVRRGVRRTIW